METASIDNFDDSQMSGIQSLKDKRNARKAFITEVKLRRQENVSFVEKIKEVRQSHKELLGVVDIVGHKVGDMVSKQREEYMIAYEAHMYDIHKQIYLLRERLEVITNDKTREERINILNLQRDHFESEALEWEAQNEILKDKLQKKKINLENLESDQEWLIERIDKENRRLDYYKAMRK